MSLSSILPFCNFARLGSQGLQFAIVSAVAVALGFTTVRADPQLASNSSNVTLTRNSVEGGNYQVSASNDLSAWTDLSLTVTPTVSIAPNSTSSISTASATETSAETSFNKRFYKVTRTSVENFDSTGC